MTTFALAITAVAADDPRILRLIRDLDADLTARYPDEPCTGGAHIHPAIRFLLAEADGRPVGCCAVQPFPTPDTAAELKRMYVAPEARGRGVAARLLAEAERTAASFGHTEMRLETAVHQPEAIALYTRAGYLPIPNYPPYQDKSLSRCYAKPLPLPAARSADSEELTAFLTGQGLSPQDVLAPGTRYWLTRDAAGPAVAAGLERQGHCVLLRSVAVRPDLRGCGAARRLVEHVLAEAAAQEGRTAYVFSTSAGAFWERLGFRPVPVAEAAEVLSDAPQVRRYRETGALADEAAWRRDLADARADTLPPMSRGRYTADAPHTTPAARG
ncbi:GNAT family N-acetyltransferase [Micromonospora sp. KC207]|uniref:GNAT family N-acetyltransferase n=1 Tax=Micromonospora sp. KC207 TaxID=2530377 RepID=UPI001FB6C5B4|nr:GNAT family N-acetyltransferase [Micromonospora sp. KC207]